MSALGYTRRFPLRMPTVGKIRYDSKKPHPSALSVIDFGNFEDYDEWFRVGWAGKRYGDRQGRNSAAWATPTGWGYDPPHVIDNDISPNGRNTLEFGAQDDGFGSVQPERYICRIGTQRTYWRRTMFRFVQPSASSFYFYFPVAPVPYSSLPFSSWEFDSEPYYYWNGPGDELMVMTDGDVSISGSMVDGQFHFMTQRVRFLEGETNGFISTWLDAQAIGTETPKLDSTSRYDPPTGDDDLLLEGWYGNLGGFAGLKARIPWIESVVAEDPYEGLDTMPPAP